MKIIKKLSIFFALIFFPFYAQARFFKPLGLFASKCVVGSSFAGGTIYALKGPIISEFNKQIIQDSENRDNCKKMLVSAINEIIKNPENHKILHQQILDILRDSPEVRRFNNNMENSTNSLSILYGGAGIMGFLVLAGFGFYHRDKVVKMVKDIIIYRDFFGNRNKKTKDEVVKAV